MPPDTTPEKPVVIVGGGWAGLSAAIHLAHQGRAVTLIEAAGQSGGRARTVMFGELPVDNGQHIALGAYHHLLELLDIIGLHESLVFSRLPLSLNIMGDAVSVTLKAPGLPAPFHLLGALLCAKGLTVTDKGRTLFNWFRLIGADTRHDMTVTELLHGTGQSERVSHFLWIPLCIAALNTHPDTASAGLFQRVLKDTFMRQRKSSDLLLPRHDMGKMLPQPAQDWLTRHNVKIFTRERVIGLQLNRNEITGVITNRQALPAEQVVLATNAWGAAQLIEGIPGLSRLHKNLLQFDYESITTVFLRYAKAVMLEPVMQGYADRFTQWVFDRRITGQPEMIAAVISADSRYSNMDKDELVKTVINDIKTVSKLPNEPTDSLVVRERRATFSATPKMERLRPTNATALNGLTLAGDYTQTGYPATLEGAVMSGRQAADEIQKLAVRAD